MESHIDGVFSPNAVHNPRKEQPPKVKKSESRTISIDAVAISMIRKQLLYSQNTPTNPTPPTTPTTPNYNSYIYEE